jgi:hypothetical protein
MPGIVGSAAAGRTPGRNGRRADGGFVAPPPGEAEENSAAFARRLRVDRERMNAIGKFPGQRRIYHAMALDPALPLEGSGHNIYPKMRLAARPVAGMTLMQM